MKRLAALSIVGLAMAAAYVATAQYGMGRRFWYPTYAALVGRRTHQDVLSQIGPKHRAALRDTFTGNGLAYPPTSLTLVGLKEERVLEAWVPSGAGWRRVRAYPILAASGGPGPKLREGDRQVPEGVYRLTGFNPNSSYHLSVRVDYPNAHDRDIAAREGRSDLGGDIFIHGKAVSIGCIAIGDQAIEELYVLLADVGLPHTTLVLAPSAEPQADRGAPKWVTELYGELGTKLNSIRGATTAGRWAHVGVVK